MYVQEGIFDKFLVAMKKRAEACAIGQPHDEKTSFGPLVSLITLSRGGDLIDMS